MACQTPTGTRVHHLNLTPWWAKAQVRLDKWLRQHPGCPQNYVDPMPHVQVNLRPDWDGTCFYRPSENLIVYQERYLDGCMAHELGHAALEIAGNRCWGKFEH